MFLRYVFLERFKKKMEELYALFDKKDSETNCPASPQNLRRKKQRKAPSSDAKLMIRPVSDTPVLSKRGSFSLLFRAQNRDNCNIFVTRLIRKNPHNQAGYADRFYGRGRRARTLGTRFWRRCCVLVSRNYYWRGVEVIVRFRKTHAKPPMIL